MDPFKRIRIKGYKRLLDVDLPMRPLCVLIEANGVGKTSFLECFDLLSRSARGRLKDAISERGGLSSIITNSKAQAMEYMLWREMETNTDLYSLRLNPNPAGPGYGLEEEFKKTDKPSNLALTPISSHLGSITYFDPSARVPLKPTWDYDHLETALSQVPKTFEPEPFRSQLALSVLYHHLDVSNRAPIRSNQPMKPALLPGANGEDLASFLYYLREKDYNRYELIEAALRAAYPGFERLDFPPVAAGVITMTWRDKNFKDPFYPHQLSDGTLRFLWLASLLQCPQPISVTMIDEPEVSLHPELLSLLAGLMREASMHTQLIVATHSARLVRFLKPEEVAVMDMEEDGTASIKWADTMDLEHWLKDYTLDELWAMGGLGGRS
jgi:predicted ATPase